MKDKDEYTIATWLPDLPCLREGDHFTRQEMEAYARKAVERHHGLLRDYCHDAANDFELAAEGHLKAAPGFLRHHHAHLFSYADRTIGRLLRDAERLLDRPLRWEDY